MASLADDFHQDPLSPPAVELAVEDLFPRAEVELARGDRDDRLPAEELALQMRVRVVLARVVVAPPRRRLVRAEALEQRPEVLVQAALVVVDEDARADVHCIDEDEPL